MDDLEDLWSHLKLTEEDEVVVVNPKGCDEEITRKGGLSLIGKICCDRLVEKEVLSKTMEKIWRISKRASFQAVDQNVFIITFATHANRDQILKGKPWLFDNMLFVIQPFEGSMQPGRLSFQFEVFWLRLHNMPFGTMTKEWGFQIGSSVGRVLDVDVDEDGIGWGNFLRIRVEVKLQKPLTRGRFINDGGTKIWILFTYKKLPHFCVACEWLLHGPQGCTTEPKNSNVKNTVNAQFGTWLRADDRLPRKPPFQTTKGSLGSGFRLEDSSERWDAEKGSEPEQLVSNGSSDCIGQCETSTQPVAIFQEVTVSAENEKEIF